MLMVFRQLLSVSILPVTVVVAIPAWITRGSGLRPLPESPGAWLAAAAGLCVLGAGLALFAVCLFLFWSRGRGTLAPWDPPRQFVAAGPYRVVRNPMIAAIVGVLAGEALLLRSGAIGQWAALFAVINAVYIPLIEEPMLAARFGEPYRRYLQTVPRFVPQLRR